MAEAVLVVLTKYEVLRNPTVPDNPILLYICIYISSFICVSCSVAILRDIAVVTILRSTKINQYLMNDNISCCGNSDEYWFFFRMISSSITNHIFKMWTADLEDL